MSKFKFELDKPAKIDVSGEAGNVIARAEYNYTEPRYLIRYENAEGVAVEKWWTESALSEP